MAHRIPPAVSLTLASALWGVATVISKALLASVPPITVLIVQLAPSVCALWLLLVISGVNSETWRGWLPLALLGLLNPGLSYTLSMLGLTQTSASATTLLWAAEPALIVVTAWILLEETITPRFLAATAAAGCGVVLVTGVLDGGEVPSVNPLGAALVLGGVFCCALYTVLSRRIASSIDPLAAVTIQQTVGLAWVLSIWPLEPQGAISGLASLSQSELLGGALSGLMYYAAAFWLYLNALGLVPATMASVYLNLTPVFGVASAYAFLGERLTASQWFGAATILLSVLALVTLAATPVVRASRK